eukprot:TRINITY_DN56852_c0_g1_i1.p2 TRINITY_DN56852_c0_g1~~TRINITY_DN56852_c0_g1_i1.p2  ORF type:complete len:134 (-),score=24.64 TRINITY_DN56852_c0_g1_i1:86-487(-)
MNRCRAREAVDHDDCIVKEEPHQETSTCQALGNATANLPHDAAIDSTNTKKVNLQDDQCNFTLEQFCLMLGQIILKLLRGRQVMTELRSIGEAVAGRVLKLSAGGGSADSLRANSWQVMVKYASSISDRGEQQ